MSRPGPKILVVEEADTAGETATRIEDATPNATVVIAETMPEALAIIEGGRIDCIVSDYEIPDASGYMMEGGQRLLEAVRERDESLPFILFTEVGNEAVARKAVAENVTDYIWRYDTPAAYDRLTERVGKAIETYWTERRADYLKRLNETIRVVHQAVVRASSLEKIDDVVTEQLLEERLYRHAAVGGVVDGTFDPRSTARVEGSGAFDWETVDITDGQNGVVVSARDTPPVAVGVVPVENDDRRGGYLVLTATRPDAFEETEQGVLAELGRTVAYARWAVETRQQLRRREQELQEQNERLERFASAVSHDLRNPLQVANGHLQLLSREVDSNHVSKIGTALGRMEALIEDVLTLARGGDQQLDSEAIDVGQVAQDAWVGIAASRATLEVDSSLGTIEADRSQLRRLLTNLLTNSVEHGTPAESGNDQSTDTYVGPGLTIRVEPTDHGFAVTDDGDGIPAAEREGLFELGRTTGAGNTGLGLAIVAKIAQAHGWDVSVTESEDGGARFEIGNVSFV